MKAAHAIGILRDKSVNHRRAGGEVVADGCEHGVGVASAVNEMIAARPLVDRRGRQSTTADT